MSRVPVQAFWHGPPLSPYERLALRSFVDHGHEVVLFTYDPALAVPAGVRLADAGEIVPREAAYVLSGYDAQGGFVAFSNEFRFELLARRGGWWVDLDVVCLRAELPTRELFFALERPGVEACEVASAVLRFPAGHPLPRRCLEECRRVVAELRARPGGAGLRDFGKLGAGVVERAVAELGLCAEAQPPATCYPVHWSETGAFYSRARRAEVEALTANAAMVHLWNEILVASRRDKRRRPPRGSFLRALFERHAIEFPPRSAAARLLDLADDLRRARWRLRERRRARRSARSATRP
jgi:hypothetical protein